MKELEDAEKRERIKLELLAAKDYQQRLKEER
jgi:hypothetical protein